MILYKHGYGFDAAGNIHSVGPHADDRFLNVLRRQTACEDDWKLEPPLRLDCQVPVERFAAAAQLVFVVGVQMDRIRKELRAGGLDLL